MTMIAMSPVSAEIGQSLPPITFGPLSRATLALYAGASGDHNPIHIDSDFAKKAGLKDVFAHGMLSMAQVGRVVTDWAGLDRIRSLSVRFQALTQIDDTITCSGEVTDRFRNGEEEYLCVSLTAQTGPDAYTLIGEAVVRAG
jgi:acyl dehydratase